MGVLQKLKGVDFYRKIPSDLTEATLAGASISLVAAVTIVALLVLELNAFLTPITKAEMIVDRSKHDEQLRINFNISFPALSCEFATLDVSDALGLKKLNLTRTVRKLPIDENMERAGHYIHDDRQIEVKYDDANWTAPVGTEDYSKPVSSALFHQILDHYPLVVANFYAPWCPWCQRLEPTWESVTLDVHTKYPEADGRIRFVKVDCTAEVQLCRDHIITGFPSIRVFRKGSDELNVHGMRDHESYRGDRTKEALVAFADNLVPSAGQPHHFIRGVTRVAKSSGCALSGFVLVKKVPGTLHFLAKSPSHSFDHQDMNMSHVVHYLYAGNKPSPRRRKVLEQLHPLGLKDDWADKLAGQDFTARNALTTFEHYLQIVLTTVEPKKRLPDGNIDAYEYTVHSHMYNTDRELFIPTAKFSYDMSPIQIVVTQTAKAFYHFITTTCAIIGGVFTVAGILDGLLHATQSIAKKIEIGKQT